MRIKEVVNKTPTGTEDGAVFYPGAEVECNFGVTAQVQAELGGTATIKLQGRLNASCSWVDLKEFTATGSDFTFKLMPEMRYSITAWTSGSVAMYLGIPSK